MSAPALPELLDLDATALLAAIRAGDVSAEQAARTYLERIAQLNPELHAVISLNPRALEEATGLDALPPEQRGALHGLPMLIKDNLDVAGLPTTAGSLLLAEHVPDSDSAVVRQLRAAGVVVLGKTNLTEWANFMTLDMPNGYSSRGGQTVNPWKAGADTGGSSSGSGAAVAARLCAAAIGTETSGSILSPAHQSGIIGYKPTTGLISRRGIVPISSTQDTPGPMTRSARDAALIASVLAGPDPDDAVTSASPSLNFELRQGALQGAKLGVVRGGFWEHVTPQEHARLDKALSALQSAGAQLQDVTLPTEKELHSAGFDVLIYEFKRDLNLYLKDVQRGPASLAEVITASDADPQALQRYGMVLLLAAQSTRGDLSERAYTLARQRDLELAGARGLEPLFAEYDALVFPKYHGYAVAAKIGAPSVNVPLGLAEGVPVGLQLSGPRFSDASLLALAGELHGRLGGFVPAR